ncbi:MAG: hypothetical protein AAB580_00360 [Patescibacteria group bacterium]
MIIAFILGLLIDLFLGNRVGTTRLVLIIIWGLALWLKQRFILYY